MKILHTLGQTLVDFFGESTDLDSVKEDSMQFSDTLDPDYLADLLFYRLYDEENKIYENKTSVGFVIEAIPILGANEQIENEINSLVREIGSEGACIQCMIWADHRIDRFLELWSKPRLQKGGIYEEIGNKKRQFFQNPNFGETPPRIFRFLLSYSEPKQTKEGASVALTRLREKKQKTLEVLSRVTAAFEVSPLQLIEIVSGFVNFDLSTEVADRKAWIENTWLSKQICLPGSAIEVHDKNLVFHGKTKKSHFKTYEVTSYPDSWNLGMMGELIGDFINTSYRIPSPFYLHYGIHFPSTHKIEAKLSAKAKILGHQVKFPSLSRILPDLPKEYEEHLLVRQKVLDGEKLIETRLSCGLWGDPKHHVQAESTLLALFQKNGFKLQENNFMHLPDFISCLPMSWGEEARYIKNLKRLRCIRTTISSETASLIPLVGEYWGNSTQGMLLCGRKGQLASWDPFQTDGNFNTVVIGPSGSGKSVLMQEMILNHMAQGGRVYILDLGRSFEKLCHLLSGQFLEFSEKSKLNLNPFQAIPENVDMDSLNASLEMVTSMIATMAMPNHKIDKERSDILSSVVKKTWLQKGRNSCIDDIINNLQTSHKEYSSQFMIGAVESLKEGLKKYAKEGTYANYFYGDKIPNLSHEIVVIETEELKNMPDLQAVILQMFIMTIASQIFMGDRSKRCLICIDEAWDLLKSPQMEGFIESLARRLRKYNGALLIGTQDISDFERSPGAEAARQNSNWLMMLGKSSDAINALKKKSIIPIDGYKELALSSLRMEGGKYSELAIFNNSSGAFVVLQLKLDPFSVMLTSTKADEFQATQELQKRGLSLIESIEWLINNRQAFKENMSQGKRVTDAITFLLKNNGDSHVLSKN